MDDIDTSEDTLAPSENTPTLSHISNITAKVVAFIAVSLSIYQLYTAGVAALTALVQRSIHLAAILALTFLLKPAFGFVRKERLNLMAAMLYMVCCVLY